TEGRGAKAAYGPTTRPMPSKKTAGQGTKAKPLVTHLAGGFATSEIRGIGAHRTGELHYRGRQNCPSSKIDPFCAAKAGLSRNEREGKSRARFDCRIGWAHCREGDYRRAHRFARHPVRGGALSDRPLGDALDLFRRADFRQARRCLAPIRPW